MQGPGRNPILAAVLPVLLRRTDGSNGPVRYPRRSVRALQATVAFCTLLAAFWLQWFGSPAIKRIAGGVSLDSFACLAAVAGALALAVMVHEMGHLAAALALDFEVLGGSLGPFRLQLLHGKWRAGFSGEHWFRCAIAALPRDMNFWRGKTMAVTAAGPAATLLAAIGASCVLWHGAPSGWVTTFWSASAQLNFFLFFLGLPPNGDAAPIRNDSTLFLAIKRNKEQAREIQICHELVQWTVNAVRPRDYPESRLAELAKFRGRPETNLLIARTMVDWSLDSDDVQMAIAWDGRALEESENCSARSRNSALAASACLEVLTRENNGWARHKFADVNFNALFPPCFAERAKAAQLLACGSPRRAPARILRAQYALPLGLAYYDYERKLLERLHLKALAAS